MTESRPHILIVDDSPSDIQFLLENLRDEYVVSVAKSGEKALEKVRNSSDIDVILLDVSMPDLDGYQTCRLIKECDDTCNVDVIFVSANDSAEEKLKGYDAGGCDYLIKPIQPGELSKKVGLAVRHLHERQQSEMEKKIAMDTAMTAIMDAGELAVVIEFLKQSFEVLSYQELASAIINASEKFGLNSTVQIRTPWDNINVCSSGGPVLPLESELLLRLRESGRIIQKGQRLILNMDQISHLVKNLPEDEEKVGRLRDHLAVILEGARNKYNELLLSEELKNIILECNEALERNTEIQATQRKANVAIMDELTEDVEKTFLTYGLTEEQEDVLMKVVQKALDKTFENFEEGLRLEDELKSVVHKLSTTTLLNEPAEQQ